MSNIGVGLVWQRSRSKGSNLLVLLAIADGASDRGLGFWGSMEHLAEKSRLGQRSLRYILAKLKRDGEIVSRPNLERVRPDGSRGHVPDRFIDVRCLCDWATYQTEHMGGKVCPPVKKRGAAKFSAKSAEDFRGDDQILPSPIRKDLLVDLSVEVQAAPLPRRETHTGPEAATYWQLVKLVHVAVDEGGFTSFADIADDVKTRAVRLGFAYEPELLTRAIYSVITLRGYDRRATRREADDGQQRRTAR